MTKKEKLNQKKALKEVKLSVDDFVKKWEALLKIIQDSKKERTS